MRNKQEIYEDMTLAMGVTRSTDHSRALSGAEWLQQLAGELVADIKKESPSKTQDDPGEGWRWLEPGEVIEKGDGVKGGFRFHSVNCVVGYRVAPSQHQTYRRRITPEK